MEEFFNNIIERYNHHIDEINKIISELEKDKSFRCIQEIKFHQGRKVTFQMAIDDFKMIKNMFNYSSKA